MNKLMDISPSLATERLILRPFTERDGTLLQDLFMDPGVTEYLPWGHPFSEAETRDRLRQLLAHWRKYRFGAYAVGLKSGRRPLGYAGLEVVKNTAYVEVLYALMKRYWGQGFAFEAAAACVKHGFDSLRLQVIVGVIAPGNEASKRVLEKLGMKPARGMGFYGPHLLYYSISKEQYESGVS